MSKKHWKLEDEEYEYIKGEVCHLFEMYQIKGIPVSGFEIAAKMGITLKAYSGLSKVKREYAIGISEAGFLVEHEGREYIFYNDIDIVYERQNWTILHEIGHIVLDHTGNSEHEEDEANFFAKYAIAPPILIHRIEATSYLAIHETFDISLEAAMYTYDYYLTWKERYDRHKCLTEYEKRLLALYDKSA